ncbi:unnamed protein product [Sphenostylis stenocarpa]|uniref:Uncharacterized protein n=1 Tax=Sphenostylis stenocarpa TaxID=92480 RepID=A0AA86VST5_9FABA|nr:unnamed protein product [Sphenostylis stenocarpa]
MEFVLVVGGAIHSGLGEGATGEGGKSVLEAGRWLSQWWLGVENRPWVARVMGCGEGGSRVVSEARVDSQWLSGLCKPTVVVGKSQLKVGEKSGGRVAAGVE